MRTYSTSAFLFLDNGTVFLQIFSFVQTVISIRTGLTGIFPDLREWVFVFREFGFEKMRQFGNCRNKKQVNTAFCLEIP